MTFLVRLLLIGGATIALYALFMDTTVSGRDGRYHNIGLQADRQILLISGCFLVLIGVILYAVRKLKQTAEQEAFEKQEQEASIDAAREKISTAQQKGTALLKQLKDSGASQFIQDRLQAARQDNLLGRLMTATLVGICTLPASAFLLQWWTLPLASYLFALLSKWNASRTIRYLLIFNILWTGLHAVLFFIFALTRDQQPSSPSTGLEDFGLHMIPSAIAIAIACFSWFCLYILNRPPPPSNARTP